MRWRCSTRRSLARERGFASWAGRNVHPHKVPGYAAVTLSLKKTGIPPGDSDRRPDECGGRPGAQAVCRQFFGPVAKQSE